MPHAFDKMVQLDPVATIDLTEFQTRKLEITKELMAAASDIGFFRVKGALWGATQVQDHGSAGPAAQM